MSITKYQKNNRIGLETSCSSKNENHYNMKHASHKKNVLKQSYEKFK